MLFEFREYFWMVFPIIGMIIPVVAIISVFKTRQKALEVLKAYAERGAEPPEAVLKMLQSPEHMRRPDSEALPQLGFFLVMAVGFGGLAVFMAFKPALGVFALGFAICAIAMAALAATCWLRVRAARK